LEKLRFDALVMVVVTQDGLPGALTLAHLEPIEESSSLGGPSMPSTVVRTHSARTIYDFPFDFSQFIEDLESRFTSLKTRLFDTSKEQAVLIGVYTERRATAEASMLELQELAYTAGIEVADSVMQRRRSLDPKTVVGKGKLEDIVLHCLDLGVDLLIFDRELSPGQLRSITNLTELRVLDRSMLILDIFAQRAKSSEGRLQVELAQLKYSLPRLTETDTGLSRLTGGIGGRGPGETKLEIGRRRARDRIALLEKKIDRVSSQRGLRRERRQSRGVPVVAIVGYTNAGKSTLLNALTKGDVFVEGKLFATLDPASRRMRFPNDREVVFVDTVGFIRELPKELVNAFRATLEEVGEADLLLHVVDGSDEEMREQIRVVGETLEMLGFGDKPRLLVINKVDLLSPIETRTLCNSFDALGVSAVDRMGFQELINSVQDSLVECFKGQDPGGFLELPPY
jgi:GTP-binding protein HflX